MLATRIRGQVEDSPENLAEERLEEMAPWVIVAEERVLLREDGWTDWTGEFYGAAFSCPGD